ncbi:MAG: hypothetical protein ISR91_02535 [Candidatus Delongbacteria bacterium]|nr:hypothetical protein [Candidatus Delongbacteria bacterium]
MKRILLLLPLLWIASCRNPFFPQLGEPQSSWTDQTTIGGLLQNFRNAYNFQDSLRYAECLACPAFQFQFYDPELGDYDWMSRQVDLTTTGRLFRHYSTINLEWSGLDSSLMVFDERDTTVQITLFFDLRLDDDYLNGWARFSLIRELQPQSSDCQSIFYPDSAVFRILQWQDDI